MPIKPRLSLRPSGEPNLTPPDAPPPKPPSGSIDSILRQTRSIARRREFESTEELDTREALLDEREAALHARALDLRQRENALRERDREVSEAAMLAAARQRVLTRREAALATRELDLDLDTTALRERYDAELASYEALHAQLEAELTTLRQQFQALRDALAEREATVRALEAELATLRAAPPSPAPAGPPSPSSEREAIEAELAAREAFVEESENTLFHKAQELQELEMHLQQLREELDLRKKRESKAAPSNQKQ